MSDPLEYPKLRWPIDIRLDRTKEHEFLLLRCPLGIAQQPLILKPAIAPLVAEFEGRLSVDQITDKFKHLGVQRDLVHELVKLLDENLFLSSPRFFAAEQSIRDEFSQSSERAAALAGLSYSADATELAKDLDSFLASPLGGPAYVPSALTHTTDRLIGLISPHIDYQRGGSCYGSAYQHLRNAPHDVFVVIGTSHQYSKNIFHLTCKNFQTPFGSVPNARSLTSRIAQLYGEQRSFEDEFLHKREHSLELQLPFMQRVVSPGAGFCPILVGSFHRFVQDERLPNEYDEYEAFAGAFTEALKAELLAGRRVCIVAGVDMAHIGSQFGDNRDLDPEWLSSIAELDRAYLNAIAAQDKAALFAHIVKDRDARRICGFPTLYTVIDVLDRLQIRYDYEEFAYAQTVQREAGCAVTFAAAGLYL